MPFLPEEIDLNASTRSSKKSSHSNGSKKKGGVAAASGVGVAGGGARRRSRTESELTGKAKSRMAGQRVKVIVILGYQDVVVVVSTFTKKYVRERYPKSFIFSYYLSH